MQLSGVGQGLVHNWGILDNLVWLQTSGAGDDQLWQAVIEPVGKLLSCESSEHHGVNGSKSCASEHGESGLWDHWHVYQNSISLHNVELVFQDGGQLGDILLNLLVGVGDLDTCVGAIVCQRICVTSALVNVPVNGIIADVHLAIWVPLMKILIASV
jgi:hypothetical protein